MRLALALAVLGGPLAAQDLACVPELVCADGTCRQTSDPDPEGWDYVRFTGSGAEISVSEGTWAAASRTDGDGTATFTATTPWGDTVTLTVTLDGGDYVRTQRQPGAGGRIWTNTGRCTSR